jgi:hypothetical protein
VAVDDLLLKIIVVAGACEVMVVLLTWYLCDLDES